MKNTHLEFEALCLERLRSRIYDNVYNVSELPPGTISFTEKYRVGNECSEELLDRDFPANRDGAELTIDEMLIKVYHDTLKFGKDAYIVDCKADLDVSMKVWRFKMNILLLGDVSQGFYFDHSTGEIVEYPRIEDDQNL